MLLQDDVGLRDNTDNAAAFHHRHSRDPVLDQTRGDLLQRRIRRYGHDRSTHELVDSHNNLPPAMIAKRTLTLLGKDADLVFGELPTRDVWLPGLLGLRSAPLTASRTLFGWRTDRLELGARHLEAHRYAAG